MQIVNVTHIDQIQKGDCIVLTGHNSALWALNEMPYKVAERKETKGDGVEIILDRKQNIYFNLGMYLKGESWVKDLVIVTK